MKYLVMLFGDESTYGVMSEDAQMATMQQQHDFSTWCAGNGVEILGGEALVDSSSAKSLPADGVITDGPYLEGPEQPGGYYLIETDSPDLAVEALSMCPNYGGNELRPIADMG